MAIHKEAIDASRRHSEMMILAAAVRALMRRQDIQTFEITQVELDGFDPGELDMSRDIMNDTIKIRIKGSRYGTPQHPHR